MKLRLLFVAMVVSGAVYSAVPGYDTLIGHRGESDDAPENTLPAYRLAVERGFGFECDIYLSKDNRVFTFHDSDLKRTTGGANTNKCSEAYWEGEIENLDVGSWGKWAGSKYAGTRPALLEEVLELARDGRYIYIEVKPGPKIVPYVKSVMESQSNATPRNVLFISFNESTCSALKAAMPEYKVFLLMNGAQMTSEALITKLRTLGVDGVDWGYWTYRFSADFVSEVKAAGFEVHAWTLNSLDVALAAFERGAMTVTTDKAKFIRDSYMERLAATNDVTISKKTTPWFSADAASDSVQGGSWVKKPSVENGAFAVRREAPGEFAADESKDKGYVRIDIALSPEGGYDESDLGDLLQSALAAETRASLVFVETGGRIRLYGLALLDGVPGWTRMAEYSQSEESKWRAAIDVDLSGAVHRVSYLVEDASGKLVRLHDESGRVWFDMVGSDSGVDGHVSVEGDCKVESISGLSGVPVHANDKKGVLITVS